MMVTQNKTNFAKDHIEHASCHAKTACQIEKKYDETSYCDIPKLDRKKRRGNIYSAIIRAYSTIEAGLNEFRFKVKKTESGDREYKKYRSLPNQVRKSITNKKLDWDKNTSNKDKYEDLMGALGEEVDAESKLILDINAIRCHRNSIIHFDPDLTPGVSESWTTVDDFDYQERIENCNKIKTNPLIDSNPSFNAKYTSSSYAYWCKKRVEALMDKFSDAVSSDFSLLSESSSD